MVSKRRMSVKLGKCNSLLGEHFYITMDSPSIFPLKNDHNLLRPTKIHDIQGKQEQ